MQSLLPWVGEICFKKPTKLHRRRSQLMNIPAYLRCPEASNLEYTHFIASLLYESLSLLLSSLVFLNPAATLVPQVGTGVVPAVPDSRHRLARHSTAVPQSLPWSSAYSGNGPGFRPDSGLCVGIAFVVSVFAARPSPS